MSKKHILVVDDRSTARSILVGMVRTIGPDVVVDGVADPLEALARIKGERHPLDLIITDYYMPVMNGVELVRQIRSNRRMADVPIVMITLSEDESVRQEAIEAGATDFLSRPIDPNECRNRCLSLLGMKASPKSH